MIAKFWLRAFAMIYMPVLGLAMVLTLGRMVLFARVLTVEEFGTLNIALIISTFTLTISCFGLFTNLQRRLPIDLQNGEIDKGAARTALTFYGALAVGMVGLACSAALSLVYSLSWSLVIVGLAHGVSQQLFLIFTTETRSSRQVMLYSVQILTRAILIVILVIPVTILTGSAILALVAEATITLIVSIIVLRRILTKYSLSALKALSASIAMARTVSWTSMGYLVLMAFVLTASTNIDRWIAAHYLAKVEFAQYAFAMIVIIIATSTQSMVNAALFPSIASRFSYSPAAAIRLAAKTSFGMLGLAIAVCLPTVPLAAWIVDRYYPAYVEAIPILVPLTIAGIFRSADFWTSYLIIADLERRTVVINLLATLAPLTVWTMFSIPTSLSISYLALSISVTSFVLSMLGAIYAKGNPHTA